jgi:hypothetical protein
MLAKADNFCGLQPEKINFVAYCHTMHLKGFLGPCDGEKILVKEFFFIGY